MDNQKFFPAIKSFVAEINTIYGNEYKRLALYGRLLEKTELVNEQPVKKHVSAFRKFILGNKNGILNKDVHLFQYNKVVYNDRVYFNVVHVFDLADSDSQAIIWEHLLVLLALYDKNSDAKDKLIEQRQQQSVVNPNPLAPMMNMVSSMLMSNLIGGSSSDDTADAIAGMPDFSALLGSGGSGDGNTPDLGKMFSLLMNSDILSKLTLTLTESLSDNKLDLNKMLESLREITQEYGLDLNIPKDASELQNGVKDIMGLFKGVGIKPDQIQEMSEAMAKLSQNEEKPNLVDTTLSDEKSLEPGIQVCYLNGTCETLPSTVNE